MDAVTRAIQRGEMTVNKIAKIIPADERCDFCKRREATLLCDVPVMKVVSHARGCGFESDILTCDRKMCENCATRVHGFDYCPDCIQRIKMARKGIWDIQRGEERCD